MNGYNLSRNWFNFCFENPEKIKPNHTALYFFCIEHCNRLGWKRKYGLPTTMAKEAIGIKSYNTYINTLCDLVEWGFIEMIEKSKNQYSSNIIALSNFNKALDNALDKALIKHTSKQSESTGESIDSIDKQETSEPETKNNIEARKLAFKKSLFPYVGKYKKETVIAFYEYWSEHGDKDKKMRFEKEKSFGIGRRLSTWAKNDFNGTESNQTSNNAHMFRS